MNGDRSHGPDHDVSPVDARDVSALEDCDLSHPLARAHVAEVASYLARRGPVLPRRRGTTPPADRVCEFCGDAIPAGARRDAFFCGKACRQRSSRLRLAFVGAVRDAPAARFAYADPPYPGKAFLYKDHPDYAGEVDHRELVARLEAGGYLGYAISTSNKSLRDVLALIPNEREAHTCPWLKSEGAPRGRGLVHRCEFLIVVGGRQSGRPVRDWLYPTRDYAGELVGRKPLAFWAWLFDVLGMIPGLDDFDDLYPGTGMGARAWHELSARARRDTSREVLGDTSAPAPDDTSAAADRDTSSRARRDRSFYPTSHADYVPRKGGAFVR